jgi:hypothetical protein
MKATNDRSRFRISSSAMYISQPIPHLTASRCPFFSFVGISFPFVFTLRLSMDTSYGIIWLPVATLEAPCHADLCATWNPRRNE